MRCLKFRRRCGAKESFGFSGTATWSAARHRCRFFRADEGADELSFRFFSQRSDIESLTGQESPRVLDAVNSRRLDIDIVKSGFGEFCYVVVITQGTRHAANPQL